MSAVRYFEGFKDEVPDTLLPVSMSRDFQCGSTLQLTIALMTGNAEESAAFSSCREHLLNYLLKLLIL